MPCLGRLCRRRFLLLPWRSRRDVKALVGGFWRLLSPRPGAPPLDSLRVEGPRRRLIVCWPVPFCRGGIPGPAVLEVRESNVAAINLYKRHGFTEVGRRKKFYPDGEGAVLMNREAGLQGAPWSGGSDEGEDRKKAAEAAAAVEPLLPGGGGRR